MDPFVGEIRIVASNFPPKGWAFCNGQILPISQNTALYSLLGTTYGGNGRDNFALPNLQGRMPIHAGETATGEWFGQGDVANGGKAEPGGPQGGPGGSLALNFIIALQGIFPPRP